MLPTINPRVVFCAVEDGAVLLSTDDEVYFGLNDIRQLCDGLAEEYPDAASDEIMADVKELLQLLREQGLVLDAA